jgi:hypothetical protein
VHIGLYTACIARLNILHIWTDLEHLDAQFMTWNTRECEEGKFAQVATDIGPADAHPMGSNQGLASPWCTWPIDRDFPELFWFDDLNCAHGFNKLIRVKTGCYSSPVTLILPDFSLDAPADASGSIAFGSAAGV